MEAGREVLNILTTAMVTRQTAAMIRYGLMAFMGTVARLGGWLKILADSRDPRLFGRRVSVSSRWNFQDDATFADEKTLCNGWNGL